MSKKTSDEGKYLLRDLYLQNKFIPDDYFEKLEQYFRRNPDPLKMLERKKKARERKRMYASASTNPDPDLFEEYAPSGISG